MQHLQKERSQNFWTDQILITQLTVKKGYKMSISCLEILKMLFLSRDSVFD